MKNIIISFAVILVLSLAGCSRKNPIDPTIDETGAGKILLKIDRENAPSNVTTVTANLTRQGYDTLTGTLNLLSSTSAYITFQSVPVGLWHLRVEAKNDINVVLYAGETDVTVQENFTTQVSLILVPTGSGIGSIYIIVNWGTQPSQWIQQNSGTTLQLRDVFFINGFVGWIVGAQGKVLKNNKWGNQLAKHFT